MQTRINYDNLKVGEIFKSLNLEPGTFKAIRVGKSIAEKVRPMKVILSSRDIVASCLRNKHKLKDSGTNLGTDLTKSQRDYYKSLRTELNNRLASGEKDLIIRYKLGVPYITKTGQSRRDAVAKND